MTCSEQSATPTHADPRRSPGLRVLPVIATFALVFAMAMEFLGLPVGAANATPPSGPGCELTANPLRGLTARTGRIIGTAYRTEYAEVDPCYAPVAQHEFNSLTPEIATFPNALAPAPGPLQFDRADAVCRAAMRRDMACGVHDVVWDPVDHPEWGIVPAWIKALAPDARHAEMLQLVTGVAHHFAGRHAIYSLANEVFAANGTLAPTAWNTTGNDRYLFDAYRAARRADPTAVLLYNDYGAEDLNAKSDAIFDLAKRLHAETVDVRISGRTVAKPLLDGVGLQSHFGTGPGQMPSLPGMARNITRLGRAGLSVYLTELDVRVPVTDGRTTDADRRSQADLYQKVADTCLATSACKGITLWGFTDAHSWITDNPSTFSGQGAAHPFDGSYAPKAAYRGLHRAFADAVQAQQATTETTRAATTTEPVTGSGRTSKHPLARTMALVLAVALLLIGIIVRVRQHRSSGPSA
jgi:endo-1,4-beta-xylanase